MILLWNVESYFHHSFEKINNKTKYVYLLKSAEEKAEVFGIFVLIFFNIFPLVSP